MTKVENMKFIEIRGITVHAIPGSDIGKCFPEALKLCVDREENVRLIHNDRHYVVLYKHLLNCFKEETNANT